MPVTERTIEELLGDPNDNARDIEAFDKEARAMASHWDELVKKYPDRFIAFYQGRVRASSADLMRLLTRMDKLGIPRRGTVVRFINAHPGNMIL
jgi:hypothetical protein